MLKVLSVFIVGCILVIGCSKDEEMPVKSATVPDQLEFKPSARGTLLTQSQKDELRLAIGTRQTIVMPEEELVFNRSRFTTQAIVEKEERIRRLDVTSYNLLKDVQANCVAVRPSTTFEGNLKFDQDGVNFKKSVSSDFVSLNSKGQISGDHCPLNFNLNYDISASASEVNSEKNTGAVSGRLIQSGQAVVLSSKYARLIGTKGVVLSSSMRGLNVRQESNNKIHLEYSFEGSYISLSETIPFKGVSRLLFKTEQSGLRSKEFIVNMFLDSRNVNVDVDMHFKEIDGKVVSKKYYLNGYETSEDEFNYVFGNQNPAVETQKKLSSVFN